MKKLEKDAERFLEEIIYVCKMHNMALYQDEYSGFEIYAYEEGYPMQVMQAHDGRIKKRKKNGTIDV